MIFTITLAIILTALSALIVYAMVTPMAEPEGGAVILWIVLLLIFSWRLSC